MVRRTYIAVFDIADPEIDIASITGFVRASADFPGWWHYLPSAFLLRSDLDADAISSKLKSQVGDAKFLVMEVNLDNSEGWLPEKAWKWIKKRAGSEVSSGRNGG